MKVISIPTRILALPQSTEIDEANQPLFLEETFTQVQALQQRDPGPSLSQQKILVFEYSSPTPKSVSGNALRSWALWNKF